MPKICEGEHQFEEKPQYSNLKVVSHVALKDLKGRLFFCFREGLQDNYVDFQCKNCWESKGTVKRGKSSKKEVRYILAKEVKVIQDDDFREYSKASIPQEGVEDIILFCLSQGRGEYNVRFIFTKEAFAKFNELVDQNNEKIKKKEK